MDRYSNIKSLVCKNEASRFKGILSDRVISGQTHMNFVFEPDSENCLWPVKSSLYELIKDGWELLPTYRMMNG